jgi:hypothetical protein
VYGQEAVLPVEVNLYAYRLAKQNDLNVGTYNVLMMDNIDEVTEKRLEALEAIEKDKRRVARAYNKRVRAKSFLSKRFGLENYFAYRIQEQQVW